MANLLYLTHRLPYPPNKGDKVRSYHLLRHLASRHRVFLGTFIDDPADEPHLGSIQEFCAEVFAVRLSPHLAKVRSLTGLLRGEALTLPYYRDATLQKWVSGIVEREGISTAVVFSSAMAQYVARLPKLRMLLDFVDVDSAKWTQYALARPWPASWIYRREGMRLLAYERAMAARASRAFFVTSAEALLFVQLAPECTGKVEALGNGVDAAFFSPRDERDSPYRDTEVPLVFTGAMDYWPNVDAVSWFASEVLPQLRTRWPRIRFYIVGMRPTPAVLALAGEAVVVTGTVPDVRPYLQHAAVVVAPLRIARGIQNKVLEAMAMARPVVASLGCAGSIEGASEQELVTATEASEFVERIDTLLRAPQRASATGAAARTLVVERYSWTAHMSAIDSHLPPSQAGQLTSTMATA